MTPNPPNHLHILVVDDNEQVRDVIVKLLRAANHTVEAFDRPQKALAAFQPHRFDLVITDASMPEMDGEALAAAIKTVSPTQPIIMVTALANRSSHRPLPHLDYLLPKPFKADELHQAIAAVAPKGGTRRPRHA